ncbi:signal transduction histidine kinase [Nakamurella sp. UYEF19]|uniref:sensor histidine kinase n=1 Tax=Nakamurella sp. UYEF19 TaxID=1756392 RepID=UPI00339A855F
MTSVTDPATPTPVHTAGTGVAGSASSVSPTVSRSGARAGGDQRLQLAFSVVVVTGTWISLLPLRFSGLDLLVVMLLVINTAFQLARHLPEGSVPRHFDLPLLCVWTVLAAALLSVRSLGWASAFAYVAAGHAGYRLPARQALAVATLGGVLSAVGLRVAQAQGVSGWPWLLGLTVALPVFLGMANRSRDEAMNSAIDAARSAQRAAESEAREEALAERARISRDIHDVLAHSLSGVSMQLELSEMLLDNGDETRAREAIGNARSMVREGMAEARRAVTTLRAETLPLAQTLQAQFWGSGDVTVVGEASSKGAELPVEAAQTLVRAAQEALTNARRHAPGAPIDVRLEYGDGLVGLQIDNGPAPSAVGSADAARSPGSGMGLVGMRERAALLGGRVEAGPILEGPMAGGWRIMMTLPR